jgi:hypothetical protein
MSSKLPPSSAYAAVVGDDLSRDDAWRLGMTAVMAWPELRATCLRSGIDGGIDTMAGRLSLYQSQTCVQVYATEIMLWDK